MLIEIFSILLVLAGSSFFLIASLGILRFPDTSTRLHALTKVDNLGLGLLVLGLLPGAASLPVALKMILIWLLAMAAAALAGHLVLQASQRKSADQDAAAKDAAAKDAAAKEERGND